MTSVAMALGEYLSLDVATTGNWYSIKYVLEKKKTEKTSTNHNYVQVQLNRIICLTYDSLNQFIYVLANVYLTIVFYILVKTINYRDCKDC